MLTYDSNNITTFLKKMANSQAMQPHTILYSANTCFAFNPFNKHGYLFTLLLQQFKNAKQRQPYSSNPQNPLLSFLTTGNVIPHFIACRQQKIIMGISMSQSQEIRRLQLHDLQYKDRSIVKFHSSAPSHFRTNENQQVDNKSKNKQVITEPSYKAQQAEPQFRINQTLNYELDMNVEEVDIRTKAKGRETQRLRESNPVKQTIDSDVLRISKVNGDNENYVNPQTMRSRKVKIGKK